MIRFDGCIASFRHAIDRSRGMIKLYDALTLLGANTSNDDALRSAYFQAVSSFDFFVHEVVAVEAYHRYKSAIKTRKIMLPMEVAVMGIVADREAAAEAHLREQNSFKAFVDPGKLAEILSCFCEDPWERIEHHYNLNSNSNSTSAALKGQLKSIWQRRNKIAHEADINPTLSGISLWPIDKEDANITIDFVEALGVCLPPVIATPLSE